MSNTYTVRADLTTHTDLHSPPILQTIEHAIQADRPREAVEHFFNYYLRATLPEDLTPYLVKDEPHKFELVTTKGDFSHSVLVAIYQHTDARLG